jgi:hypothetical protein
MRLTSVKLATAPRSEASPTLDEDWAITLKLKSVATLQRTESIALGCHMTSPK